MLLLRVLSLLCFLQFLSLSLLHVEALLHDHDQDVAAGVGTLVRKSERSSLIETEYGQISAVKITDGTRGPFYLQFITLEPNSLFLPALLQADMVFYVHTGSGRLSWDDHHNEIRRLNIRRGDVYRLKPGSVFFIESDLEPEREKLRLYAIFSSTEDDSFEPEIGAYTSISDLVLGFDKKVLQSAFKVPEDLIEALTNATRPPQMVHALPKEKTTTFWELEARFLKAFLGGNLQGLTSKKKKTKTYNIIDADHDFENCNGWSATVDRKDLHALKHSNIGIFMVNLTKGSMMGPHWNPMATELAIVLHGEGMIRVVCPSTSNTGKKSSCKNRRFRVEEGDVFAVPRFHPMAQMSFNNDTFVFMGFSTTRRTNYPQFLAGKRSVLQALDDQILATSFNVSNTTIHRLLAQQADSVILDCTSCAEEEEMIMEEEIRREREEEEAREREEERKREEEEARKREEEERKREKEEARKREEEERKREKEEARKREEEERKREEEEARKREEEEREREEEEEARRREEEEEEEARRREEEEEARKREEEEKEREEEEARKREEEEARGKGGEEEEREREKEEKRRREEAAEREQEEARRQEEKRQREEEQPEEE